MGEASCSLFLHSHPMLDLINELLVGSTEADFLASTKARTYELPDRDSIKNLRMHKSYP